MGKHISNIDERNKIGKRVGGIGIFCNIILFISKFAVGISSGSTSIQADAFNNLSDAASAIVTILGFEISGKPADNEHPYGHARFEYLANLVVAVMILMIGIEFFMDSVKKMIVPVKLNISVPLFAIMILSIALKIFLMFYNSYMGRCIESNLLKTTAADCRNDVIITSIIVVSAVVEHLTGIRIDGMVGGIVSVFMIWNGIAEAKQTISRLLGEGATAELENQIFSYINGFPTVIACHELLVHDYGPGKTYASIHVQMSSDIEAILCHEIIDTIERECFEQLGIYLTVHYDPVSKKDLSGSDKISSCFCRKQEEGE